MSTHAVVWFGILFLIPIIFAIALFRLVYKAYKLDAKRLEEIKTPEGRKMWFLKDLRFRLEGWPIILENFEKHLRQLRGEVNFHLSDQETSCERVDRLITWATQLIEDDGPTTTTDLNSFLIQEVAKLPRPRRGYIIGSGF